MGRQTQIRVLECDRPEIPYCYTCIYHFVCTQGAGLLPFAINTESKQIVSIHWTGSEGGTGGSVTEHR